MEISDVDIEGAERNLLPQGMAFDEERRQFIKHLESCDLLAVPGSGKTTALQAKLFCISRHLPLDGNQGVLVLSHTNNAVNEIKKKLHTECYQLFEAPHFIGTVQDFVDKFLAIPYYELFYKKKVQTIDNLAYIQEVNWYVKNSRKPKAVYFLLMRYHTDFSALRIKKDENGQYELLADMDTFFSFPDVKKWENEGTVRQNHMEVLDYVKKMKEVILKRGILTYDDCYIMAKAYMHSYPFVKESLRKRFRYIFIDETQDLKKYQLDLIDSIFNSNQCCLQRIGDKNQTIFKRPDRDIPEQWSVRNLKTLLNSFRLTDTIAHVVDPFTVDRFPDEYGNSKFVVKGKRTLEMGDIPPYLIIFDETTKEQLLPCFNQLIDEYRLRTFQEGTKYGFHIVGWNLKPNESTTNSKLHLCDIFPNCNKLSNKGLNSYATLSEFLVLGCREGSMSDCKSVICKILLYVLRILGKTDKEKKYYTQTALYKFVEEQGESIFVDYLKFVYQASVLLYHKKYADCYNFIVQYIDTAFSTLFKISKDNKFLADFYGSGFNSDLTQIEQSSAFPDIKIESVHSVKGQTHCATMYVETSYKKYESEHLFKIKKRATKRKDAEYYPNPLFQEQVDDAQVTTKSAMHMMYVGFSRPTHLLCYAVVKDIWNDERIGRMEALGWKVIKLSN